MSTIEENKPAGALNFVRDGEELIQSLFDRKRGSLIFFDYPASAENGVPVGTPGYYAGESNDISYVLPRFAERYNTPLHEIHNLIKHIFMYDASIARWVQYEHTYFPRYKGLTEKQDLFVHYVLTKNQSHSASFSNAGYKAENKDSVKAGAHKLFHDQKVSKYIKEGCEKTFTKYGLSNGIPDDLFIAFNAHRAMGKSINPE